jgi:thiol:disulfide interchange protein DsbD
MIRPKLFVCLFALTWFFAGAVPAQSQPESKPPLKIDLATHPAQISPGQRIWLAVTVRLEPGWHIYGNPKGPGPGLPTTLRVTSLPETIQAEAARFLPAKKLTESELGPDEWVWTYSRETTIYLPLDLTNDVRPGHHPVKLELMAALCSEGQCVPYKTDLTATLTVVSGPELESRIPPKVIDEIQRARIPGQETAQQIVPLLIQPLVPTSETPDSPAEIPQIRPRPVHRSLEVGSLFKAAIFALLAGFILNFMPCVLPVVSLKILGFIEQAQGSKRRVALMGLSFSGGILTVFLVLAGLASFAGYGWGELFQKQSFLVAMIALVFSMSLCLFGLFQLPIPSFASSAGAVSVQRQGYWESFYKGTLATFLATPCSGPLLGGAMAWTLRQPPTQIFLVFTCLGAGMAAPYVAISFFPVTLRWLPKPGNWLIHFERLMGFALLATVLYLLSILSDTVRIWVVVFCFFLALGFYIWGQMTSLSDSTHRRLLVRLLAVLIMGAGTWLSLKILPSMTQQSPVGSEESLQWQSYTDMKLLQAARDNRWAVIDFTADWCPNCILVERTALNNPKVRETFAEHHPLLLKADLTRENPQAKRLLDKMGSRSIPFLALFPPGEQFWQPFFLRDIYRPEDVIKVFSPSTDQPGSLMN